MFAALGRARAILVRPYPQCPPLVTSHHPGLLTRELPDQQRIRCLGLLGVLCAPTAHQTNGPIGASPKTEWPTNLKSTIRRVRRGNYHLNYSTFQKSSTKNSSKSKNVAPLPDRRGPIQTQKKKDHDQQATARCTHQGRRGGRR